LNRAISREECSKYLFIYLLIYLVGLIMRVIHSYRRTISQHISRGNLLVTSSQSSQVAPHN